MIRVTSEWTGAEGSPYYTTMHFGGSTQGEATAAANAVAALWNDLLGHFRDDMSVNVSDDVPQIDVVTGDILQNFVVSTALQSGLSTGDPLPPFTQALLRLRTGVYIAGRELRGKVFIPGLTENDNLNGRPLAALMSEIQDDVGNTIGGLPSSNFLLVWSPTHGEAANITSQTVWDEWALLRSRRD